MSELSGKFKGELVKWETTQNLEKPFIRVVFKLKEKWDEQVEAWEEVEDDLDTPSVFCSKSYWLQKEAKYADSKMSPFEYSKNSFRSSFGFELTKYKTLIALNDATRGVEKIIILEADSEKYHTIKYINNFGGKVKEGMVELSDLLGEM